MTVEYNSVRSHVVISQAPNPSISASNMYFPVAPDVDTVSVSPAA